MYARTAQPLAKRNAQFRAAAAGDTTSVYLYDEIGYFGVTAARFVETLAAIDTPNIELHINSPGGSVFDGIAIYNALVDHHATINVRIDGWAASAASFIAMAGETIEIADSAFIMIHNAWTIALGDADEMAETAKLLAKIDGSLSRIYADRTGLPLKQIRDMMAAETWMDSGDAVENGFADKIARKSEDDADNRAVFDASAFRNAPRAVKGLDASVRVAPAKIEQSGAQYTKALAALENLHSVLRGK